MWLPWERDRLAVHADELQANGDPLGERILSSLALERCTQPGHAAELRARIAELEAETADPRLDELLRALVVLQPRWDHGMIVELRIGDGAVPRYGPELAAALFDLAQHPRVRMIQSLELPFEWFARQPRSRLAPIEDLLERRWSALTPRVIRLCVAPGQSFGVAFDNPVPTRRPAYEAQRGLLALLVNWGSVCLSRLGPRQNWGRANQLAARLDRAPLDPVTFTWFARAFWDGSRAVRDVALDGLSCYGVELAALIPDLLRLDCPDRPWLAELHQALSALGAREAIVEATAPALDLRVAAHRLWLESSVRPDALARRRGRERSELRAASPASPPGAAPLWAALDEPIEGIEAMPDGRVLVEVDIARYQIRELDGLAVAELQLDAPAEAVEIGASGCVALAAFPGAWLWRPAADEVCVVFLDARALALTVLDEDRVLIACNDGSLREWIVDDRAVLASFDHLGEPEAGIPILDLEGYTFDPALGVRTRVLRPGSARTLARVDMGIGFRGLARLRDGRILGFVEHGAVYLWTLKPDGARLERRIATDAIAELDVLEDGRVAITNRHRVVRVYAPDLDTELGRFQIARPELLRSLGDGRIVAVFDDTLEIWDVDHDDRAPTLRLRGEETIHALAILPDDRIVTIHQGGRARLWTEPPAG